MDNAEYQFNDEFLLQCISNYKPLYDKSDKGYKSILQRENCWANVARSLRCSVSQAKARFKSLREKFRREVQLMEKLERSGAPASARPVWPLMSFFKFMYKCGEESERQTTSNIPLHEYDSQSEATEQLNNLGDSDDENIIVQFEEEDNAGASQSFMSDIPLNAPTPRKRKSERERLNLNRELSQIDSVLVDVSTAITNLRGNEKTSDRYNIFGQYLASELRTIGEPHASFLMEELQLSLINYKRELRSSN